MATSKKRKNQLMVLADEVIQASPIYEDNKIISESYNGQIAAFSVSVALSGLKPAMALYYSGTGSSEIDKKKIIELLAMMYNKDKSTDTNIVNKTCSQFYQMVISSNNTEETSLRRNIIEYAIALKLAIRTFKFKES